MDDRRQQNKSGNDGRKRPRADESAPSSAPMPKMRAGGTSAVGARIMSLLEVNKGIVRQSDIQKVHPDLALGDIVLALNDLSKQGRVEFFEGSGGEMSYRLVSAEVAAVRSDLSVEETMVLLEVERSANVGVWVRNIKLRTKLQQTQLTKILKRLEARKLIKPVRSVAFKNRRMYMAYNLNPAKELTGGPWYTNEVLDMAYVNGMRDVCVKILKDLRRSASAREITTTILAKKVSNAKIGVSDVRQLLDTLVFDGLLDYADGGSTRLRKYPRASRHLYPGLVPLRYEEEADVDAGADYNSEGSSAIDDDERNDGPSESTIDPTGFSLKASGPTGKYIISAGGASGGRIGLGPSLGVSQGVSARMSYCREPPGENHEDEDEEDADFEENEDEDEEDDDSDEEEDGTGGGKGRHYVFVGKSMPDGTLFDALSSIPCGICPVMRQCVPGGVVSPETCTYYTHWLQDIM